MLQLSLKVRRRIARVLDAVQIVLFSILCSVVAFRLGNMQLDGLLTFGGAFLGVLFGFTSLMYNRARTYPRGPTQRRSIFAAELVLRATLSYAFGAVFCAAIFFCLQELGYHPTPANKYPTQTAPVLWALVPLSFLIYSFSELFGATRMLLHRVGLPTSALRIVRHLEL